MQYAQYRKKNHHYIRDLKQTLVKDGRPISLDNRERGSHDTSRMGTEKVEQEEKSEGRIIGKKSENPRQERGFDADKSQTWPH